MPDADDNRAAWFDERGKPAERLVAFERWLATRMGELLIWPRDPIKATRQIGQCRSFVMLAVADLAKHGYLFKPAELRQHLESELRRIGEYQKKSEVRDLFAYFETCWDGWVRRNAEELRAHAARLDVLRGKEADDAKPRVESIGEIVLRDLEAQHEKKAALKRFRAEKKAARKARCNAAAEPLLPGFSAGRM